MEIYPAILTNSEEMFTQQLRAYGPIFPGIDIDINVSGDAFEGLTTLDIQSILGLLEKCHKKIGFHIMVSNPAPIIRQILSRKVEYTYIIYVHQEYWSERYFLEYSGIKFGVVLNPDSSRRGISFYKQFQDVQCMTVQPGRQGRPFVEAGLEHALWLRNSGYNGVISVDGGVSEQTASIIAEYSVDRVSVGSYFSQNLMEISKQHRALSLLLNK